MAGPLYTNIDDLNIASKNFEIADRDFFYLIKDLNNLLLEADGGWEGEAADAFRNVLNQYISDISAFRSAFKDIKCYTDDFQKELQRIDEHWKAISEKFWH